MKDNNWLEDPKNEIAYNLGEYDSNEGVQQNRGEIEINVTFEDGDLYNNNLTKDRNMRRDFMKEGGVEILEEPKNIEEIGSVDMFENPMNPLTILKTNEVEKDVNVWERNNLIDVYSYVAGFNGTVQWSLCHTMIGNNQIKIYCPECTSSNYIKISKETYESKIGGKIPSNLKIFSEKDEFKTLGTKQKFSTVPKQKQQRKYKGSNRRKYPVIYCINCLKNGIELGYHKNTHSYKILDKLEQPVFNNNYTLIEEATFINGITKWGIDNWFTLDKHFENEKDWKDLFNRFYTYYYDISVLTGNRDDPMKYLMNSKHQDPHLKDKAVKAMLESIVITKDSEGKYLNEILII